MSKENVETESYANYHNFSIQLRERESSSETQIGVQGGRSDTRSGQEGKERRTKEISNFTHDLTKGP